MSINRGMNKEDAHVYNGKILLSHQKERNNVICRDVGRTRDYHTERSRSEKEKQILYNIVYIWNLKI